MHISARFRDKAAKGWDARPPAVGLALVEVRGIPGNQHLWLVESGRAEVRGIPGNQHFWRVERGRAEGRGIPGNQHLWLVERGRAEVRGIPGLKIQTGGNQPPAVGLALVGDCGIRRLQRTPHGYLPPESVWEAGTTRTFSPSMRESGGSWMTWSAAVRPVTIWTFAPSSSPMTTGTRWA